MRYILLILLIMTSCSRRSPKKKIAPTTPAYLLLDAYNNALAEAKAAASQSNGWLEESECDAMLWAGKYACGGGKPLLEYAEYVETPGKFNRRPEPHCGVAAGNSATTWSRDMGMGLLIGAWCNWDSTIMTRHMNYGKSKDWSMGEPYADGRAIYTPAIIGMFYQAIYRISGADNSSRKWPSIYSEGLNDYQAHLQIIDIWIRSEIDDKPDLDVSTTQWERIKEHYRREPMCAFYSYMYGAHEGNLDDTISILLDPTPTACTYLRGSEHVTTSEWLFVAKLTLEKMGIAPKL